MMDEDYDESMNETQMQFSTASTTIDPSVVQSRIRQSASLRNEDSAMLDDSQQPVFPKLSAAQAAGNKVEYRRVRCPTHRYTPLREHWEQILTPLVEYLKLQVRNQQLVVVVVFFSIDRRECVGRFIPSIRYDHCVVPGTSNPPGSLNESRNEMGRLGRCLTHAYPPLFIAFFLVVLSQSLNFLFF